MSRYFNSRLKFYISKIAMNAILNPTIYKLLLVNASSY